MPISEDIDLVLGNLSIFSYVAFLKGKNMQILSFKNSSNLGRVTAPGKANKRSEEMFPC